MVLASEGDSFSGLNNENWRYVLLPSERSEQAQSCSCSIEISDTYVYIYMSPYVKLYTHARWYIMWEELSVNHIKKHSNHLKRALKMFLNGFVRFGYYITFNLLT